MGKKTEYKRQFREPSRLMQREYQNNVELCRLRRQRENSHFFVEWDWESESENGQGQIPPENVNNSNYGEDRSTGILEGPCAVFEDGRQEKGAQTPDWHRVSRSVEGVQQVGEENHRGELRNDPSAKPGRKSSKKRSGSAHKRKSRPSTSPESGGKSRKKDPKPPFLAFGWADGVKEVGSKMTYNIRATNEVHPAAMRAFKRKELDIEREEERRKRELLKKKRMRALFNMPPCKGDDDTWQTEYQRNFSGRTPAR